VVLAGIVAVDREFQGAVVKIGIVAPGIWDSIFVDTARTMAQQGHHVAVYTDSVRAPSGRSLLRLKEGGVDYYVLHPSRRNPWLWPLDKLAKPVFGRRFFTTLWALHRYFLATRDRDIYLVESDWMGLFVGLIRCLRRFRWVVGVHDTDHLDIALDYPGRPRARWMQRAKLWVLKSCDGVRANSYVTRDALVQGGVPASRITVIPLHLPAARLPREHLPSFRPLARSRIRLRYGLAEDARLLMVICRLAPVKGIELAVHAMPQVLDRYPNTYLMICGPDRNIPGIGSYRGRLESEARRSGVGDRLIFPGNVEFEELRLHLAAADVHLAPSLIDTFSYSVVDAAMAGTRSVVSDKVGVAYWMLQAGAGVIVGQRDPSSWAQAINCELATPPGYEQMAGFVRELAALLDCGTITTDLVAFLAQIAQSEVGGRAR
jgi:glycosyltransferase involved in cell wall biosynthesis